MHFKQHKFFQDPATEILTYFTIHMPQSLSKVMSWDYFSVNYMNVSTRKITIPSEMQRQMMQIFPVVDALLIGIGVIVMVGDSASGPIDESSVGPIDDPSVGSIDESSAAAAGGGSLDDLFSYCRGGLI